jgi:hypothetical protein
MEGGVMQRTIRTMDDVLGMLDRLFVSGASGAAGASGVSGGAGALGAAEWWDGFYADRDRAVPFFAAKPDENLMSAVPADGAVPAALSRTLSGAVSRWPSACCLGVRI